MEAFLELNSRTNNLISQAQRFIPYRHDQILGGFERMSGFPRWDVDVASVAFDSSFGRVAKWQTRWLQVPVFARTWGFKSPLAHLKTVMQFSVCQADGALISAIHIDAAPGPLLP